ncbi:hypothetical protein PENANT_c004G09018 [Penicillium antarcticum]|uniref:Uncharacterized protein n=1 Tax=Penicillium antarcticum TaxID=416450 RepID=A0A1V6QGA1_9EURO|nr:hypothetical protein PENANT_c004G09018 [Penicillium antarcticum]
MFKSAIFLAAKKETRLKNQASKRWSSPWRKYLLRWYAFM